MKELAMRSFVCKDCIDSQQGCRGEVKILNEKCEASQSHESSSRMSIKDRHSVQTEVAPGTSMGNAIFLDFSDS
jgi:hypothetical protein